jgi:hypothetical protein
MADAADPFGLRQKPRHEVETAALEGNGNPAERGAAKSDLIRRDREYAEKQELSRRTWEDQRENSWRVYEGNRRAAERAHDQEDGLWKLLTDATARDAQAAIRVILAANGGAAIAVLAFTAGLVSRQSPLPISSITPIVGSLRWFACGAISSVIAALATYLTNGFYGTAAKKRLRTWQYPYIESTAVAKVWLAAAYFFHAIGMLAAIVGLVFFAYGLFKVQQKIGSAFR